MKLVVFALCGAFALAGVNGQDGGCSSQSTSGVYDYKQALCMSFLFYEAQRSGYLPDDNRIYWRGDSAQGDGSDSGRDLTGGYYDAGDHVKFGFPMAFTSTALAWGLLSYPAGYANAGQTEYAKAAIRWTSDYYLKCNAGYKYFFGQVGDGETDHQYWGRPEDMSMWRPSYAVNENSTASDLIGETSAALASAFLVFKDDDPTYAALLLQTARDLFTYADENQGDYNDDIPNIENFYKSWSGYGDELAWSSLWLYKATGEQYYLDKCHAFMDQFGLATANPQEFSWDNKIAGVYALHIEIDDTYRAGLQTFVDYVTYSAPKTAKGLVFLQPWGTLRHAANVAFVLYRAADYGLGENYRAFAEQQMHYALGSTGRSYVCGFGYDPPQRPHHRSSSCPDPPASCDGALYWDAPNPHVLYGALVGGPGQDDSYEDKRDDYVKNEVACDYNALFTGCLAALAQQYN